MRQVNQETYEMIVDLYTNGMPCLLIEEMTGVSQESIRRWMKEDKIYRSVPIFYKPIERPKPIKRNKYDYVFEEPINQGKFYSDYVRDGR